MRFATIARIGLAVAVGAAAPTQISARAITPAAGEHTRYSITILNNLRSGGQSFSNGINNRGWVSGFSDVSSMTDHAAVWKGVQPIDLGTLGGPNSFVGWPNKSDRGLFAGDSDTSNADPYNEQFCDTSGDLCLGFVWSRGRMTALSTLGGNNAQATSVNNAGTVVGFSETPTQDPSCIAPQLFDWNAAVWNVTGAIRELPPVAGDVIGAAVMLNNRGEAVGGSGPQCGPVSATLSLHAVVWRHGSAVSLPTLGGQQNNAAVTINDNGEMAGFSDLPGDTVEHAVLWKHDRLIDAGVFSGDASAAFFGINSRGQAVGNSCSAGSASCRAILYDDGTLYDVNSLASASGFYLANAADINDSGEITGQAVNISSGLSAVFVAVPNGRTSTRITPVPRVALPENLRHQLQLKAFHHFGRPF